MNNFSEKESPLLTFIESKGLPANVILRIEDSTSIMEMVERGIGVSILPQMVLNDERFKIDIRRTNPITTRIYLLLSCKSSSTAFYRNFKKALDFILQM